MSARDLRRYASAAVLAGSALALSATDAHATHFRYGTIRWEVTTSTATTVDLKVTAESAWRCTFFAPAGCSALPAVVSTGQTVQLQKITPLTNLASAPLNVTVTSINPGEDWFVGTFIFTFTNVAKANLPARVFWQGNARISTLQDGNNDQSFRVESVISGDAAASGGNAASPAASILPIITLAHGLSPATFFIPAADVEGDTLTWSISPTSRSLLVKAAPDGADNLPPATLSINPATGEVSWNTVEELVPPASGHFYAVQFLVRDSKGAETPVDALLRLVPNQGTAPRALIDGSTNSASFSVRPLTPVTFTVTGEDDDAGASVTLTSGALPIGATMTPSLPYAGTSPRSSVFNWTPTLAQAGNTYVVSFAVTDNLGLQDTNSAQITVLQNFPPTLTCPAPATVEATGPTGAPATVATTVDDPDDDPLTVNWSVDGSLVETDTVPDPPATVDVVHAYSLDVVHPVHIEVADGITAPRTCDTSVQVVDTTPPDIHGLPANMVLEATSPAGAVATWAAPTATDIVDITDPVTCAPASGSTFPLDATTTVTCTSTDAHGNSSSATFTVKVQDTTPPDIHNMPADITVQSTGPNGAVVSWPPPNATDIVDITDPVVCAPPSGSLFPIGVTTVTCTATDAHNNSSSRSFTVTVLGDTTPPDVCVNVSPGSLWPPNHKMVPIAVTVVTHDQDPNPTCTIASVTSNEPVSGPEWGPFSPDWTFSGLQLSLRAERYSIGGRLYTITVACTDENGNTGTSTAVVKVPHDQRPGNRNDPPQPNCNPGAALTAR